MPKSSMLIEEELTRRAARTERRLRKLEAADRPGPGAGGTTPDTVSALTGNTVVGTLHRHAVLASSNPGNNEVLLKTDENGHLHLAGAEFDQAAPVSVVFQEDGIAIIGGSLAVVSGSGQLAAAVASADTTIDFGQTMTPGVFVIIRGTTQASNRAVEFVRVGTLVSGTTYNVTRDVTNANATDPAWPKAMPFAVLGAEGDGRLWMTSKPARYWVQLQGTAADAYTNIVGMGELNGGWGYSSSTYGMALGEFAAGKANLTWDPTNGLRIRRHTDTLFQVDNNGHATIAGWDITTDALSGGTGNDVVVLSVGDANYRIWAGHANPAEAPFSVMKNGMIKSSFGTIGGWTIGTGSLVSDGGRVVLHRSGYMHIGQDNDILIVDGLDDTHRLWAGHTNKLTAPFAILKDGSIKATAGTIGGWNITATALSSGTDTDRVVLTVGNPTYRFWAGAVLAAEAPFSVTKEGVVKASSGTVGGWTLSANSLVGGNVVLHNSGYMRVGTGDEIVRLDAANATYRLWSGNADPASAPIHVTKAGAIGSGQYVPGSRAWRISELGDAEFNNVSVRGELHSAVMVYGEQHATAGTLVVAKSAGKLKEDVTTLAYPTTFFVRIEDPDTGPVQLFELFDYLRIKDGSGNDNWLEVRGITRSTDHWRYQCWLRSGTPTTFRAGATVVDYGQAGDGYLVLSADAEDGPYYDVRTHQGQPWNNSPVRVRLGLLDGIEDMQLQPSGWGLYASNVYLHGNLVSGGGAVKINQWGIEIDKASGGDAITWTTDGALIGRITSAYGYFNILGFSGSVNMTAYSGAARPTFRLGGDGAGLEAKGWASLFEDEHQYASEFVGLRVGGIGKPAAMLDVQGGLALYGASSYKRAIWDMAVADYTDNTPLRVFSLTLPARGMWCGEITLSTHRTGSGSYGALSRYWLWVYRDTDGVVRQNVIRKLDDYTVTGQVSSESLTTVWDDDTLYYTFQRDHTATPATALTVVVQGYGYRVSNMRVAITDPDDPGDPQDPPDPPDPPPPPSADLVPGHYWMLDAGTVDRELATALFYWSELEPTAGNYNWSIVDSWLDDHPDGIIQVFFHTSGMTGDVNFQLWLPPGVPYYTITNSGKTAYIPAYDQTAFQSRYISFINAFGARYDGQPVIACLGLDGESQCAKTQSGVDWITACYGTDANAVPYRFRTTYLDAILEAYRDAFPNSTVLVNCAPGGTETRQRVLPLAIDLGLGLKHSGVIDDTDSWLGYDASGNPPTLAGVLNGTYTGLLGLWDIIRMGYEAGLTIVTESAYGMCPDPMKAVYAALSYHPVAMTWHKEWFNSLLTQAQFDWAELYLARTKATTPGVWWAHHQSVYPKIAVGSKGYYSGHGHCEFWLTQTDSTTWTVDSGVTLSNVRVTVQYTGTGTMTINGQNYSLGASGSAYADITSTVTQVKVTGASVRFIEIRRLSY